MNSLKKKKNVAFFAEKLYGGGVEKILQIILRNFDYERYNVTLYSSYQEVLTEELYPTHINHYHYFSSSKPTFFGKLKAKVTNKIILFVYYHFSPKFFYRIFIRRKYDIGIAFIEGYATRIISGGYDGMKKIAWVHTDMEHNHWTDVAYHNIKEERCVYNNHIDKIVCVSKVVMQKMIQFCNTDNKIIVLHNPIERDSIIEKSKKLLNNSIIQKTHKIRIVTIGSLIEVKGYDRLLRIAQKLYLDNVDFELIILGEGKMRVQLQNYITQNNLSDVVKLVGYLDNPYPIVKNCDLYICSSYAEGYNTAITEALILGKAIVSTECSGVKEQLGDNNEWGICTPNTEEGLYQGIKQMLSGNNLAHYTRQAEIRGGHFTLDKSMNEIYKLIDE